MSALPMPADLDEAGAQTSPMRHPLHFLVTEGTLWPELENGVGAELDPAILSKRSVGSANGWLVRTHYELGRIGVPTTTGPTLRLDAINVVSPRDFGRSRRLMDAFILWPRADGHRPMMANYYVEQNTAIPEGRGRSSLPYWPQPGILPRDPSRDGVRTLSFKGRETNLMPELRTDDFRAALARRGVAFDIDAFGGLLGAHSWHDYRKTDVVVAIRNMTVADARHKPASKLVNAWFGEVPAILGPEPAFQALRRSELDYLEVRSPEDVLAVIERLQTEPGLYEAMVENGRQRRDAFRAEAVAQRWVDLINDKVGPAFERWSTRPDPLRPLRHGWMMLAEPVSKWRYRRSLHAGPRILSP